MINYSISGIWKHTNGVITHYAVHEFNDNKNTVDLAKKVSKFQAVKLLEQPQNKAITLLWDYTDEGWQRGTAVVVVGTGNDKYLRTTQDSTVRDNLGHLINYGMVSNDFA